MPSDFATAFRDLLKLVVREVVSEALNERRRFGEVDSQQLMESDDRFLLSTHEAAERLSISRRHLSKMTCAGELPCVRVGRRVLYSTKTIREWIKKTESTAVPTSNGGVAVRKRKPITKGQPKANKPTTKKTTKRATAKKTQKVTRSSPKKKFNLRSHRNSPKMESEKSPTPFDSLLKAIGVDRSRLPPVTNGDLRRIAEVDIATMHGWIYLNRELPDIALKKLRDHFGEYRDNLASQNRE